MSIWEKTRVVLLLTWEENKINFFIMSEYMVRAYSKQEFYLMFYV